MGGPAIFITVDPASFTPPLRKGDVIDVTVTSTSLVSGQKRATSVADLLVIPITPSAVDVPPSANVLRLVREAREARGEGRPAALLVPNRIDPQARYDDATREAFAHLRERWAPSINLHVEHGAAFARGVWIGDLAPGSDAASEMFAASSTSSSARSPRPWG